MAWSNDTQSGEVKHNPIEVLTYSVGAGGEYCLGIKHYSGVQPDWVQLQTWSGLESLEYFTRNGSINNPSESANAGLLAVGAADWADISTIESFSSQGPAPDGRIKPDIVGADGGSSVTYGHPFSGTSQASPHLAGLAALVRQRFPDFTPEQTTCLLYTSPSPRDRQKSRMPSSA